MNEDFYKNFEEQFKVYAGGSENIRAAFVMGSRARKDHPADEWSDLDIFIYCHYPEKELRDATWLSDFGKVVTSIISKTAAGDVERLTLFEGGYQVDTVYFDMAALQSLLEADVIRGALARGLYPLVDKDKLLLQLENKKFELDLRNNISEEQFMNVVNGFWFLSIYIAKQALRNNLWTAKKQENNLREFILQMVEWYEKMVRGDDYDTWYAGKFINEWAYLAIIEDFKQIYTGYTQKEIIKGVQASMQLFKRLSLEIGKKYGYQYPCELMDSVTSWMGNHTT